MAQSLMDLSAKIIIAFALDLCLGDPRCVPHPVRLIGWVAKSLERPLRRLVPQPWLAGIATALIILSTTAAITAACSHLAHALHPFAGEAFDILCLYTCFACHDLLKHSKAVLAPLLNHDLANARSNLAFLVGRDTVDLSEPEIVRATIESVAENMVDGITAPLFFAFIGGPVGAMTYKAINTLDSTFGYKNPRYLQFGWASARIDDAANYLPARLTAPLMVAVAWAMGLNAKQAFRILRRDGRKHPSPNSGLSESVVAGALEIQLGGTNTYNGIASHRPKLGDATRLATANDILLANRLVLLCSLTFLFVAALTYSLLIP